MLATKRRASVFGGSPRTGMSRPVTSCAVATSYIKLVPFPVPALYRPGVQFVADSMAWLSGIGQQHRQGAPRCEVSQRLTRYWPVAPPVDSDHQVIEVDPVQPLLIVSSAANSVID